MTEKEKALAGFDFIRGDKDLKERRDRAEGLCYRLNNTPPEDIAGRKAILRELIPDIGEDSLIKPPFICEYGDFITPGKNFFANYNCKLMDGGRITFGDNVLIGPDCTFVTAVHPVEPELRLEGHQRFAPITVGDNVWFGARVTVCPGVSIGSNSAVGAGSVVTKDIPENSFAAGVPCKVIRKL